MFGLQLQVLLSHQKVSTSLLGPKTTHLLTKLLPWLCAQAYTPSQALVQALGPVNQPAGPPDGVPIKS